MSTAAKHLRSVGNRCPILVAGSGFPVQVLGKAVPGLGVHLGGELIDRLAQLLHSLVRRPLPGFRLGFSGVSDSGFRVRVYKSIPDRGLPKCFHSGFRVQGGFRAGRGWNLSRIAASRVASSLRRSAAARAVLAAPSAATSSACCGGGLFFQFFLFIWLFEFWVD